MPQVNEISWILLAVSNLIIMSIIMLTMSTVVYKFKNIKPVSLNFFEFKFLN